MCVCMFKKKTIFKHIIAIKLNVSFLFFVFFSDKIYLFESYHSMSPGQLLIQESLFVCYFVCFVCVCFV